MAYGIASEAKPATAGQNKEIFRMGEDTLREALAKAGLFHEGAQRIIERGDEFKHQLEQAILSVVQGVSITNQFANEEVASTYSYLSGYQRPKAIVEQVRRLQELFPGIGNANQGLLAQIESGNALVPSNQEGFFAFPHWKTVAPTYGEAVQKVFNLLGQTLSGKFTNYREGKLGPNYLQETDRKAWYMQQIQEEQGSDILIVPAQFGLKHRGRSVRRALAVMDGNEFGLGAFEIGIMLLLHPERLAHYDDLYIDCPGDKVSPGGDGTFPSAPYFEFRDRKVRFGTRDVGRANGRCGSASAVRLAVPQ